VSLSQNAGSAAAADCRFGADRARTARHEAEQAVLDRRRDAQLAAEGGGNALRNRDLA
jgi:hypothetical protein